MSESTQRVSPTRVRVTYWINRGWGWFVEDLGTQILVALIPALLICSGFVFILIGPVCAGLALVGLRKASLDRV